VPALHPPELCDRCGLTFPNDNSVQCTKVTFQLPDGTIDCRLLCTSCVTEMRNWLGHKFSRRDSQYF
jgi:hypothetical protein